MNFIRPAFAAFVILVFFASLTQAQHGGGGGHSSGGFSGHSVGHSFGRVFGHHSSAQGKGTSPNPQGVLTSGRPRPHRGPLTVFAPARRFGVLPFGQNYELGYCGSFGGFPSRRFFIGDFDCFQQGFFFDPFFSGGYFPAAFGVGEFGGPFGATDMYDAGEGNSPLSAEAANEDPAEAYDEPLRQNSAPKTPDTLLQLKDGSMYGLTDYWLVGDRLHYITNYGGENSIPLERVDFEKSTKLNAEQGIKFEPRPRATPNER